MKRFEPLLTILQIFVVALVMLAGPWSRVAGKVFQSASDTSLAAVRRSDRASREADGKLVRLTATEHARRANIYMSNRAFAEAREHWDALLTYYPEDSNVPPAIFGIGRSLFWERKYAQAMPYFE